MKRFLAIAIAAGTALMLSGSAFAAGTINDYGPGTYANGIARSRHNLGNMGNYITVSPGVPGEIDAKGQGGGASEICVFCHTPHHTTSEVLLPGSSTTMKSIAPAPLWNRARTTFGTFIGYGTTIGGTTEMTTADYVGGVTLACLSCHDGVTAMDNLVNIPGPGLERATTVTTPSGWTWADATDGAGSVTAYQIGAEERLRIGGNFRGGGSSLADGFADGVAVDLSDDHPMSVTYNGADSATPRASLRDSTTGLSTIDLSTGLFLSTTGTGTATPYDATGIAYATEMRDNISQNRWAVKGFISDTATITDLLRNGKVECSSCHDPHFKNLSNGDLDFTRGGERDYTGYTTIKQDGLFLRRVGGNAGSGVCRTCHNK